MPSYVGPTCTKCGAKWVGKSICHCATCHLTFASLHGFDTHRIGLHANGTRRCLTEVELRALGLEPNHNGHWRKPANGRYSSSYWMAKS